MMNQEAQTLTYLGRTPVIVHATNWFPISQVSAFMLMIWYGRSHNPDRAIPERILVAGLSSFLMLGSEWAHNTAHLVASQLTQAPMDEFQIVFGIPRCIYYDLDDPRVSPREHIIRSAAGPIFNLSLLPLILAKKRASKPGSSSQEIWDIFLKTNIFLSCVSLLPIPGIDGGPILKWSLVEHGASPEEADQIVRQVNGPLAILLGMGAGLAALRKKRLLALLLGTLATSALGIFLGLIKESEIFQSKSKRNDPA
jgi:hypothetical protein